MSSNYPPQAYGPPVNAAPHKGHWNYTPDQLASQLQQTYLSSPHRSPHKSPACQVGPAPPASPTSKPNQCQGTTTAGKRCTRIVGTTPKTTPRKAAPERPGLSERQFVQLNRMLSRKARPAKASAGSDTSEDEQEQQMITLPRFCHQHLAQGMQDVGTYAGAKGLWIVFDEWIPNDLPTETKLQLRHEMAKPTSPHEKEGFIYVHEMALASTRVVPPTTLVKVGRSTQPVARLSQWRKQCPQRTPIVRDFFPLHPSHPLLYRPKSRDYGYPQAGQVPPRLNEAGSRLRGALLVADQGCPFHHRLERLILIEIAGRVALETDSKRARAECAGCGQQHLELFEVTRGAYEAWIVDVILRWEMWCRKVLAA